MRGNKVKNNKHIFKNESASQPKHELGAALTYPDSPAHKKQIAADMTEISAEERRHLIADAAYFRSERRNFAPGLEIDDWLNAEAEIERKLSELIAQRPM